MSEFLQLLPPQPALELLLQHLPDRRMPSEKISSLAALSRVTAAPVYAPHPLPSFRRSTVDGYALRAADTFGASESLPTYLRIVGEAPMGKPALQALERGECVLIHTGGMLPETANAVVMLEHSQRLNEQDLEILRPAALGENVLQAGEDVQTGDEVIPAGALLRPAEIGGLAALGILEIEVVRRPRVAILSTGDEVVPPQQSIQPGQVRDVNTYTLSSLVQANGGEAVQIGILPDQARALAAASRLALETCDVVVITAGSSASTRDLTAEIIQGLGQPGVLVHGVNVRPGKPSILGVCNGKAVIGLPGNPVSALVIARLFLQPVLQRLLGRQNLFQPTLSARLTLNLASQAGREDWVPVRLLAGPGGYNAEPLFGRSNLIFPRARADGLLRIPADATGLEAGALVEIHLL